MKHVLIITQYHPLPQRSDLPVDNSVIRALCRGAGEEICVTILLCHVYRKTEAVKRFLPLLADRRGLRGHLYRDEDGRDVLLCEHPSVLPRVCSVYPCFARKYARLVREYLAEKGIPRFDAVAVHFPTRHTGLAGRIPAARHVAVFHAFDVKSRWRRLRMPGLSARYDALLCRAPWIKAQVKAVCPGREAGLCLSGLPAWMLKGDLHDRRRWKEDGVLRLLFAGKLNRNKNVEAILCAVRALVTEGTAVRLTVIGEGEERAALEALCSTLGLSHAVTFAGRKTREEVFAAMRAADAFVMVSKSETLGLAYMEAMAAGAVVVASKGRGVDGIVEDGKTGFLADCHDGAALTQKLRRVNAMGDAEACAMRDAAFRVVSAMDEDAMSRLYLAQVLGEGRVTPG